MSRPVTLFTGQWADLSIAELLPQIKDMGYDGVELACWGDHFDVGQASDEAYLKNLWKQITDNGLTCYSISTHLVSQAVCDNIDARHQAIISPELWGDGDPEGVRQRAAAEVIATAHDASEARRAYSESHLPRRNRIDFSTQ